MMHFAVTLLAFLVAALPAAALEVREVVWGFDGHVVPEHFNVVSVLVANPSIVPFDGTIRLHKVQGVDSDMGAPYAQSCYVSASGSRWIQFFPYVNDEARWRLEWGRGADEERDLDPPTLGPPAQVFLYNPEGLRPPPGGFRSFPDNLFPPSVAAADGLDSLLLDYAPRWEAPKRAALLDWLRRGGTLHILRDPAGRRPVFGDGLEVLNGAVEIEPLGAGRILRHAMTRAELTPAMLQEPGCAPPSLATSNEAVIWRLADSIFPALSRQARPRHNWWLIDILTLLYIGAVGPGVFFLGRRLRDYRQTLLALVAGVACFGGLFNFAGRRGQGESGMVHSLAHARALDNDQYLVTQWVNVFVTRGDYYKLHYAAPHNLYAVPQDYERVNGVIQSGKDGVFAVDMPLYSQRSFVHRARLPAARLDVRVRQWPVDGDMRTCAFPVGPGFPRQMLVAWALYRDAVWPLELRGDVLTGGGPEETLDSFLQRDKLAAQNSMFMGGEKPAADDVFRKLAPCVIAWSLGGTKAFRNYVASAPRFGEERIRLFILAHSPASFEVQGAGARTQTGCVLYDLELTPLRVEMDGHEHDS